MRSLAISVIIPIVILVAWVVRLEWTQHTGMEVRMKVEGYDPRDLLSGHYLLFRLSLDNVSPCVSKPQGEACVCLGRPQDSEFYHAIWGGSCSVRPSYCKLYLRGNCDRSRFDVGIERFYFPEEYTPVLQTLPNDSSAILSVRPNGTALLIKLLVGDRDILDFARTAMLEKAQTETIVP